ncbi:hypothetical protein [Nonomuraea maheshkhaliensis]|uniref:hypothetical protein n=1 Tax=Nonomuraea maheshkhaliensis TaxID=419590 RepID=UPI0031F79EE3
MRESEKDQTDEPTSDMTVVATPCSGIPALQIPKHNTSTNRRGRHHRQKDHRAPIGRFRTRSHVHAEAAIVAEQ